MGALGRGAVLALMATCNFVVFTFVALLGPFFPSYARSTYDASSLEIGLVFALVSARDTRITCLSHTNSPMSDRSPTCSISQYPIAQIAVCPLASLLCNRLGRVSVCSAGLVLLSASTALFALSSSMPHFMAAR
jgi:MFS family permease